MNLTSLKGRSVWITGASSGIGLEMALLAADAGAELYLLSSRREILEKAAQSCHALGAKNVHYDVVDLSDLQATVDVISRALTAHSPPDFLILNAGVSQRSQARDTDLSVTKKIMDLNFFGAVAVARTLLPAMLEAGGAHIGVTSSVVGEFGFPLRSAYSASKMALHGYFETLGLEYADAGIRTTLVMPGRIRTGISLNALGGNGERYGTMDSSHEKGMEAQTCARKYWHAVIRGRREVIIGGVDTVMVFFHRYLPWLFRFIAQRVRPV